MNRWIDRHREKGGGRERERGGGGACVCVCVCVCVFEGIYVCSFTLVFEGSVGTEQIFI